MQEIKVTFTVSDVSEAFFSGFGESIKGIDKMTDRERFDYLMKLSKTGALNVKSRVASGQFRDAVELNSMLKGECKFSYTREPRRGYQLLTFFVSRA